MAPRTSGAIVCSNVAEANIADPETDKAYGHVSIVVEVWHEGNDVAVLMELGAQMPAKP